MVKAKTSSLKRPGTSAKYAKFKRATLTSPFAITYVSLALATLLISTAYWALLGARVHGNNADQLVNPYMFENASTFSGATFPGQHTYLLKWPIFWLVHAFGAGEGSYRLFTILVALLSVGIFAYILYRIEKRPLVFGTLIFALSSILFLTPAQPFPGMLLPVNMAMIANRNIEYVLYIGCLYAFMRAPQAKHPWFYAGLLGLSILIATDKLFMSLSLGGSLLAFTIYAAAKKWRYVTLALRWFMASVISTLGSVILLWLIPALSITGISNGSSGPYGIVSSLHNIFLGTSYAVISLLTNFGANPAYDTTYIKEMPVHSFKNILHLTGPGLLLNLALLAASLLATYMLVRASLSKRNLKNHSEDPMHHLALAMVWTSIAAAGAFVVTDHYYAGDARYLTICMFTLLISTAVYSRRKRMQQHRLVLLGIALGIGMLLGAPVLNTNAGKAIAASSNITNRNNLITQALHNHPVNILVGDYWRVIPIKHMTGNAVQVMPLQSCTTPRDVLTSRVWQPDVRLKSFAYIVTFDKGQTDFPQCTIEDAISAYGRPNANVVIAGTIDEPKELLLFYDHGSQKSAPAAGLPLPAATTTSPINLKDLPNTICTNPTVLNIVAHEDDDLLFMNPDTEASIKRGECVRTLYITAGDAGSEQFYWLGREQGSQAAYAQMVGADTLWIQRTLKIGNKQYVTVSSPRDNKNISLIYMRLPDGNLYGEGFSNSKYESLEKLLKNQVHSVHSVYGESTYTQKLLIEAVAAIMHMYQPSEIRTHSISRGEKYHDHSDHAAVSKLVKSAYAIYEKRQYNNKVTIPITYYLGYPSREFDENVMGKDLESKTAAFLYYAKHDRSVCHTIEECTHTETYGSYLRRQHRIE